MLLFLQAALLSAFFISQVIAGATISSDIPPNPRPEEQYLFYQHSKIMEEQGLPARHAKFGEYAFLDILKYLQAKNLNVIAEWRPVGAKKHPYAFRIARKVNALIEKGVPAKNITLAGLDKGSKITLIVSSYVGNPAVNYVLLGGCPRDQKKSAQIADKFELIPNGRILSIRNRDTKGGGDCSHLLKEAETDMQYQELTLTSSAGQGLFYRPDPRWIDPLIDWIRNATVFQQGQSER